MDSYKVQSILIPKNIFHIKEAKSWISKHYKDKGIDDKDHYFRFRQLNPDYLKSRYKNGKFRNKVLNNGIVLVLYYYKL